MGDSVRTSLKLIDGLAFEVDMGNHHFVIDTNKTQFGGKDRGPAPKSLILPALGGCTAMDVTSILNKMKVPFTSIEVEVVAETNDEHPVYFTHIHLKYIVRGKNLNEKKIYRAVQLSQETYCGVSFMLKKSSELTHEIVIEDEA